MDYKFVAAALAPQLYHGLASELKTDALRPIALNFEINLTRVLAHVQTPIQLMFFAGIAAKLTCQARMEAGHDPDDEASDLTPEVIAATKRLTDKHNAEATTDPVAYATAILASAEDAMRRFLKTFPHLAPGIEATLSAMTMDAWMAFEALAGDLWRAAINAHPQKLAANCIRAKGAESGPQEKQIALSVVERYRFNLSGVMGNVLAESNKFNLDSFKGIEHAYASAFAKDWNHKIWNGPGLSTIEAFRNLYAHRGGIIDSQFIKRARHLDFIHPLEAGQMFHADGEMVRNFLDIVITSGLSLVHFVDEWANAQDHAPEASVPLDPSPL